MIIDPSKQGSPEWLIARAGIPTASEWDAILTPTFKARTGEMPKTYLARKLAEKWLGGPLPDHGAFAMEQGQILEAEAIPFYELETGQSVDRVGLCMTDDRTCGCSPDGLIGNTSGLEIKCPRPETHVRYLLSGVLPSDYAAQVHGSMFVTGRTSWIFMSYCRGFPPFMLEIQRDADIQNAIRDAVSNLVVELASAYEKLIQLNGGKP